MPFFYDDMAKTKYKDDFPERAKKYAQKGLTDEQIAHNLGISVNTYYVYQEKYPQFLQAIKAGKAPVDDEVESALLKRALGYEYDEVRTETLTTGNTRQTVISKQVLPDVTAQIFWLKNRRPEDWRDRQDLHVTKDNTEALNSLAEKLDQMTLEEVRSIAYHDTRKKPVKQSSKDSAGA